MGGLGLPGVLHPAIAKAMSIAPEKGSTFYDAEHIVILMQENRSFDHTFGMLKGVRGFSDKRNMKKPDGTSVLFQKDKEGNIFAPFNLDIRNTKATWMSSLPHSWTDQIDAWNHGKMDNWLESKRSGEPKYRDMPLTMGFYNRQDLPFYYQLADAFTVCDHYFCSSLTGTTPNRLYLWTGTIRSDQNGSVKANVKNEHVDYGRNVSWKTYPEVLEENGISWRIYQNEISLSKGLSGEEDAYLANFTDNPLEWFSQYHVKFSSGYTDFAKKKIIEIEKQLSANPKDADRLRKELVELKADVAFYTKENFEKLPQFQKNLHEKAFTTNQGDPDFHKIELLEERNGEKFYLPKGDILHRFRKDVKEGKLPQVSWLVAPERFSDHPTSPWYGAWYISEVMNILTENPEVWRKTIFILTYDENDGYYDHMPPFYPPNNPQQKVDVNGAAGVDYVDFRQNYFKDETEPMHKRREGPIGLGYRVPMIVASPWSRGGFVNSEVADHTSVIRFLETFLSKKNNKNVRCENISNWRREICGNLVSVFNDGTDNHQELDFLEQKSFMKDINQAKEKPLPSYINLKNKTLTEEFIPRQEDGFKKSCALPYHYEVNFGKEGIEMKNPGQKSVPIIIYDYRKDAPQFSTSYALYSSMAFVHPVNSDENNWEISGPNGFYRKFVTENSPKLSVRLHSGLISGDTELILKPLSSDLKEIIFIDHYLKKKEKIRLTKEKSIKIQSSRFHGWYDVEIEANGLNYRFCGREETGKILVTEPYF